MGEQMTPPLRCGLLALTCVGIASAQFFSNEVSRSTSSINTLIQTGRYEKARDLIKNELDYARIRRRQTKPFYAYLTMLLIEVGNLKDADNASTSAVGEGGTSYWDPVAKSEQAALLLERGDYASAVSTAKEAYRLSTQFPYNYYSIRAAYFMSIEAQARARQGDLASAIPLAAKSVRAIPRDTMSARFFEPRILYGSCLVNGYADKSSSAEADCLRGLKLAEGTHSDTRDVSLGYLILAEVRLRHEDLHGSRDASLHSLQLTQRLFGMSHQDAVKALAILALIDLRTGNRNDAQSRAKQAIDTATIVFGEGSLRMTELRRELQACFNPPDSLP